MLFRSTLVKIVAAATAGTTIGVLALTDAVDYNQIGAVRIARAGCTVVAIAADYKWTFLRMKEPIGSPAYLEELSRVHQRSAEKLKELCCKNRGAFIKVGQHLGSLDYLVPPEYVNTMKSLFRDAPESPFTDMLTVLREDLKTDPSNIFTTIDPKPLGAASLAQVHRAVLKDGTTVAVKIQHPNVDAQSRNDIKAMKVLVIAVAKAFPEFKFVWLAEETEKILPLELDFLNEGKNCERMAKILSKFSYVKLPKIFWEYSTKRILTMEFCDGGRIDDLTYYKKEGISPSQAFCRISKVFSEMIFIDGYLHCDPHPGNILVSKDLDGLPILTLLDHGVHMNITEKTRLSYGKLWLSMLDADVTGMQKHADELGVGELFDIFACMLTARSWTGVKTGIQKSVIGDDEMRDIKLKIGTLLPQISDILNRIPREVLLILKTNDLLRGLSYKLKVQNSPCTFSSASLACTRAIFQDKLNHTRSPWNFFQVALQFYWTMIKIRLYELYLTLRPSVNPLVM
ncbi:putative aarF domain-containing protein kinase 1 [Hypsibius exemplaris]|uniref:AarF domain-containing protein kinase 1 n=1 Tax=Hypsibius exemplaris TaxID=2072580 RepID=A0A9X6NFH2_HYPEX|nr:putative aarF domain-containing protein kinase 1 [Hypsibius exemplaris]